MSAIYYLDQKHLYICFYNFHFFQKNENYGFEKNFLSLPTLSQIFLKNQKSDIACKIKNSVKNKDEQMYKTFFRMA